MPYYFQSSSRNRGQLKRRKKLLVAGSFVGGGNVGDSAALISLQQFFEELELPVAVEILSSGNSALLNYDNYYYLEELNEELVKYLIQDTCLLLVLGGGSFFGSSTITKLQYFLEHSGIKTALFCIGTDFPSPKAFDENKPILQRLLKNIYHLSTRSPFSQNLCHEIGVVPTEPRPIGDIVHLMDTMPSFISLKNKNEFTVGVNLCSHWDDDGLIIYMAQVLDCLVHSKGNARIVFIPFDLRTGNDMVVHRKVVERMKHKDRTLLVQKYIYPPQLQDIISQLDLMIGMRLHANVMAYNVGTPHIAINYHAKVKSFMEWIGLSDHVILECNPSVGAFYGYGPPLSYLSLDESMDRIEKSLDSSPVLSLETQRKEIEGKLSAILKECFL